MTSQSAKVGGSVLGGSGILVLMTFFLNGEINKVDAKITTVEKRAIDYVDSKHNAVLIELRHLRTGQNEMKLYLEKLDNRLYQLKDGGK